MRQLLQVQSSGMLLATVLAGLLGAAAAWPYPYPLPQSRMQPRRFVAVPLEDVQLIREVRGAPPPRDYGPLHHGQHRNHRPDPVRSPLGEPYGEPQPQATFQVEATAPEQAGFAPEPEQARNRFERQSGGGGHDDHEYVDYGAHTGHHGAFGWYADFPVITKGHR